MKGFGIEIKNNLLDPKHIEHMGIAVWLYMWCIDKMTSIDESGVGKVLGGKPIQYKEVGDELGISVRTYRRWVTLLVTGGYINTITAPHGLIFYVNKAHKRFGKRYAENGTPAPESSAKNGTPDGEPQMAQGLQKMAHHTTKSGTRNKTIQLDKTVRQDSGSNASVATPKEKAQWFFTSMQKQTLEQDAKDFLCQLTERTGREKGFVWQEVKSFVRYWTEKTPSGRKERWETERTFEVDRRLTTWFSKVDRSPPGARRGKGIISAVPGEY